MDNGFVLNPDSEFIQRCPKVLRCSAPLKTIVVHGHDFACSTFKSNIIECCTVVHGQLQHRSNTIWQLVMKECSLEIK